MNRSVGVESKDSGTFTVGDRVERQAYDLNCVRWPWPRRWYKVLDAVR